MGNKGEKYYSLCERREIKEMLLHLLTLPYGISRRIHTKLVKVEAWAGGGGGTEKDKGGKWSLKA